MLFLARPTVAMPIFSCGELVRIMPLGDSITYDDYRTPDARPDQLRTSYRLALWQSLLTAGYQVNFVGSQHTGPQGFDPDNEGHPGWTARQILNGKQTRPQAGNLAEWLQDHTPDVVLLHIGTNDMSRDMDAGGTDASATAVTNILTEIFSHNGEAIVILARIISRACSLAPADKRDKCPTRKALTTTFNAKVDTMALAHAHSDKIAIVDMENGANLHYDAIDMHDDLHPKPEGYEKMADVWMDGLRGFWPVCGPGLSPPTNFNLQ